METIVALATGTGGAIAVIRLSGPDAIRIADGVFRAASGSALSERKGYTITFGRIEDAGGEMVDEVLVSLFRAPRSYTGEDMVEISSHASPYVCRRIIELLIEGGARMATPGEFTVRAFLAGKMDLSQAEAVADVIASADRGAHALALGQMRGGYSDELAALRGELLALASLLELELDFSEEDVTFADRGELDALMARTEEHLARLASSFSLGNAIREGVPVAIVGEPNVGKSTLLNALLREDRAMVSDIAGTTRDVIEEGLVIDGVRYRFLDTAGLRATDDPLERMGIERTHASVERARIVLWMIDARGFKALSTAAGGADGASGLPDSSHAPGLPALSPPFQLRGDQHMCIVINKSDLLPDATILSASASAAGHPSATETVFISAKSAFNLTAVTDFLRRSVETSSLWDGSAVVSNARHHASLTAARASLSRARALLREGAPTDLLSEDIRQSLHHLGEITGQITTDEILGEIFSKFCI